MAKLLDKQTLSWLAAIFEGKPGRMSFQAQRGPRIKIQTTNEKLVKELVRLCGGNSHLVRDACPSWCKEHHNHRRAPTWSWEAHSARSYVLVNALVSYFRLDDPVIAQIVAWEPNYNGPATKAREELKRKGWRV